MADEPSATETRLDERISALLAALRPSEHQRPLILLSCGRRKRSTPQPARELYTSPRFRACRKLAEEVGAEYFIVSAKHGLVAPDRLIEPYDVDLSKSDAASKERWAADIMSSVSTLSRGETHVLFLGAEDYAAALRLAANSQIQLRSPLDGLSSSEAQRVLSDANKIIIRKIHLVRLYGFLKQAIDANKSFALSNLSGQSLPRKGVYIFLDPREPGLIPGTPRIVRIGTHGVSAGSKSTLRNRLRNHLGTADGGGNHRGSIFRLHVGQALLNKTEGAISLPSWGAGQDAPREIRLSEMDMERRVSEYIAGLHVVVIEADDPSSKVSQRAFIESNLIALLTEGGRFLEKPNPDWLGLWANSEAIRSSGLWNVRDVGRRYEQRFGGALEALFSVEGRLI